MSILKTVVGFVESDISAEINDSGDILLKHFNFCFNYGYIKSGNSTIITQKKDNFENCMDVADRNYKGCLLTYKAYCI